MNKPKKIFILILTAIILFGGIYATTYIPKKVITIMPEAVSKIEIFDGNRGERVIITKREHKEHIISNLNEITFQKGKLSIGYLGYKFRMTIYDNDGKEYKELIIDSSKNIRYSGFFYTDQSSRIDYEYINDLF